MIKNVKIEDHSKKFYSGFILPTSLFFMFASAAVVMVYYNWLSNQLNELDYRIAVTKATYNAESGIAEKAFPYLLQSNYVTGTVLEGRSLDIEEIAFYDMSDLEGLYVSNWGTYVDLPSGNIISSDIELGLFVLELGGVSIDHQDVQDVDLELESPYILFSTDVESFDGVVELSLIHI